MSNDHLGDRNNGADERSGASPLEPAAWPRRRVLKAIPLLGMGAALAPALEAVAAIPARPQSPSVSHQARRDPAPTSNTELCSLSVEELGQMLKSKQLSPVTLVNAYLERINGAGKPLNAYIRVLPDRALADARRAEQEIAAGHYRGPLHGIPIALKDLYDLKGVPTTGACKLYLNNIAKEDAPSVARLKRAGAIIIGKTNMNELALGARGQGSAFGPVENPWMTNRITGGSSSGSGAAVAAGLCAAATGSDTGGSIRIPSALCGVVGIKPTYGRVSCRGLLPVSWSQDTAGPLARTVTDAALLLGAMSGYDPADPASADRPVPNFTAGIGEGVRGLRIVVDPTWTLAETEPDVQAAFETALAKFRELHAEVIEMPIPQIAAAWDPAELITATEALAVYGEAFRAHPQDVSGRVRERVEGASTVTGVDYTLARRLGATIRRNLEDIFQKPSLIAAPTCPIVATKPAQLSIELDGKERPLLPVLTRLTRVYDLTRMPAISLPCGFSREGLPIGLQLAGPAWNEALIFRAAYAYEQAADWRHHRPEPAPGSLVV